jgi:Glycosyl hydrolase family 48/Cellulose binding domain/Bacterial Ig domain
MIARLSRVRALSYAAGFFACVGAMVGAGAVPARAAGPTCRIDYVVVNDWQQAFQANITITNLGPAITTWQLQFAFPGNQQITQIWNTTPATPEVQSGRNFSARDVGWNGTLATNASTTFGFIANENPQGTNPVPTAFTLNGQSCNHTAPIVAITNPAAGATFTAPATVGLTAMAAAADGATITSVAYFDGTTQIGSATASPFSVSWQNVAAGDHNITAVATDSFGTTGTSPPIGIHVTAAPSVLVTAPTLSIQVGGTATFGVRLSSAPSANTTVTVAKGSGDAGITISGGASLTFTPSNFGTNQTVTVAASSATASNGTAVLTASAPGFTSATVNVTATPPLALHDQRFLQLYQEIKNPSNGYFSPQGIPYHSVETLIVEAPDYGHETTSEAFSFWLWLEASFGRVTRNWTPFNNAWSTMEQFIIPSHADQPTNNFYNAGSPATFAPEQDLPSQYPTPLDTNVKAGQDPLAAELASTYGNQDIYGMHWLLDVDNKYGYGHCGDGTTKPAFINTFQRGPQESVWETIPQPSCETFQFGAGTAGGGYLPLFIADPNPAQQWRYTDAPDADARAVEAAYWALQYATQQGQPSAVAATVAKAAKLGDYLRYSLFDKYFKQIGNCVGPTTCAAGVGKNSADYLLGWYYAWGGCLPPAPGCSWAWRIGDGVAHFGYQNPLAAWALSNVAALKPLSPTAAADWSTSLTRQLQFYTWLQSAEGAIAGGVANSWAGRYATPPAGDSTFFGMAYDSQPVYHDPPSNQWFGWQAWSMERVAEYYNVTNDANAKALLDKWVAWASANTTVNADGTYQIPNTLGWTGQPNTFTGGTGMPGANANLHVNIVDFTNDVGVTAAYAKTLSYYAAKSGNAAAKTLAQQLLDGMWTNFSDPIGLSVPESRKDYNRFDDAFSSTTGDGVFVPASYSGKMPNGDPINSSSTFLSIRSWYTQDPNWSKVQAYLSNPNQVPTFSYHRFWAESDIAIANDVFAGLFGS